VKSSEVKKRVVAPSVLPFRPPFLQAPPPKNIASPPPPLWISTGVLPGSQEHLALALLQILAPDRFSNTAEAGGEGP
jgi:hypothetical protein